jgi:SAM-dependent methyltransferase
VVAELGPGDSLGIGLAALLSGADEYYALDVVHHADETRNLTVLEELIELFKKRTPVPDRSEFPGVKPFLNKYDFPSDILTEENLKSALAEERLASIRRAVQGAEDSGIAIRYFVPWNHEGTLRPGTVDFIYSQAVLEYVDDLTAVYGALHRWLKPGGFMSHQIDFKSHGITKPWNGHWAFSDGEWKILQGKRPYFLNRGLFSAHVNEQGRAGFRTMGVQKLENAAETASPCALPKQFLTRRFRDCSDEELAVSGALIQTCKLGDS